MILLYRRPKGLRITALYPASSCTYYTVGFILYRIRGLYVVRYYSSHTVFSSVGPDPLVTIGTRAFTLVVKRLLEWVCPGVIL